MILLVWLTCCILSGITPVHGDTHLDPSCNGNCKCCKNEICETGINNWPNVCTLGCIDGHRGARCYELCQYENCKSCGFNNNVKTCTACYDGYYLGLNKDCTHVCPPNCESCTSREHCTACKEGFYNDNGSVLCDYSICPEKCICSIPGKTNCTSCQSGYYDPNNECRKTCPYNCESCVSSASCISCKNGYYNGIRNDSKSNLQFYNCTHQCKDVCTKCESFNNCSQCVNGTYGTICQYNCSVGCKDNICELSSGNCKCSRNFSGNNCTQCADGKYGNFCNLTCPINCYGSRCEKQSGNCTDGCSIDTVVGSKCNTCISGMFGEQCSQKCPVNCKNKACEMDSGICSCGCDGNFNGTLCKSCLPGKYGEKCERSCPFNCADGTCDKNSGDCFRCVDNYYGKHCNICKPGNYGPDCADACSENCYNRTCHRKTGVCDYGCTLGFSGDMCCVQSVNCIKCNSSSECVECKTGFYRNNCSGICPDNCLNFCDFSTGVCAECKAEYFGPFCSSNCSKNCSLSQDVLKSMCEKSNGKCRHGCVEGQHGPTCSESCSRSCLNSTCWQNTGKCKYGCVGEKPGPECIQNPGTTSKQVPFLGPVVGGLSAFVVAAAVGIVATVLFRRRRRAKDTTDLNIVSDKRASGSNPERVTAAKDGHVYANIHAKEQKGNIPHTEQGVVGVEDIIIAEQNNENGDQGDTVDYYNYNPENMSVKVANLFSYVTGRNAGLFEKEFKNLPKPDDLSKVCRIAKKPENIALNRYNGIYPFDHSRVTIPSRPKFFINACYIDGYNRKKAYIASFGPTAKTTDHFKNFWRMVWHEKSDVIVMLTNLHEESGMKCEQYWPDADTEIHYDQVKVKCRSVEEFAEYTVRTFTVSKGKEHRNLTQLHFTAWPDKGVPSEVTSLIEFRQRVKAVPVALDGPIIVHCSAGVGRTGTYIALDILTEQGQAEDSVDVFGCVSKMRGQRVTMVQTAEQYKFLHKALVHSLTFDCEAVPAERLQSLVFEADDVFTRMFWTLKKEIDTETEENVVAREENTRRFPDKSRRHSDIPGNRARVRLYLSRKSGDYDFINAVFISSFKTRNLFIAAQTPLPSTVEDFLCMIYQQSASCVVALESPESSSRRSDVGKYLPADNESYRCGDFTVTSTKFENKSQYVFKILSVQNAKKGDSKTVYHFQYTNWRNEHKVADSAADFVHFVKEVEKSIGESDTPHIVVHCLNGYERSGLFCVVYKLLEKLEAERQVSVVNIVRKIRTQRKLAVSSVEQLKFCYQCISAYLESYNIYSNFAV